MASTGQVGKITISKTKFRSNKKELEVQYTVEPPSEGGGGGGEKLTCDPPSPEAIAKLNSHEKRVEMGEGGGGAEGGGDAAAVNGGDGSQVVTPWEVEGDQEIDYDKLIKSFGSLRITEDLVSRIERLTGKTDRPRPLRKR